MMHSIVDFHRFGRRVRFWKNSTKRSARLYFARFGDFLSGSVRISSFISFFEWMLFAWRHSSLVCIKFSNTPGLRNPVLSMRKLDEFREFSGLRHFQLDIIVTVSHTRVIKCPWSAFSTFVSSVCRPAGKGTCLLLDRGVCEWRPIPLRIIRPFTDGYAVRTERTGIRLPVNIVTFYSPYSR